MQVIASYRSNKIQQQNLGFDLPKAEQTATKKYVALRVNGEIVAQKDDYFELIDYVLKNEEKLGIDTDKEYIAFLKAGASPIPEESRSDVAWIFWNKFTMEYLYYPESEISDGLRWQLQMAGYSLYADSVALNKVKEYMKVMEPDAKLLKYQVKHITFKEAKEFVEKQHRHHKAPQGHKFSQALYDNNGNVIGVAIVGRPVARHMDDGDTLEVTRCCVREGFKNAVSRLYSCVVRIAKEMGYGRVITYTLATESGVSMRAAGFVLDGESRGGSWNSPSRKRVDKHPTIPKFRWVKQII